MKTSDHLTEADVACIAEATADPLDVERWLSHLEACESCTSQYQSKIDGTSIERRVRDAMSTVNRFNDEAGFAQLTTRIEQGLATQRNRQRSIRMKVPSEIGQCELIRMIGCGGMGVVFEARQRWLNRKVAVKLLRSDRGIDQNSLHQFTREFEAVGRLDHPGIVRAFDAGCSRGHAFLVMELVDGLDLDKVRRFHGVFSEADTIEIAIGAAEALSHAHQNGVIHRDVKPSNLMLARDVDGAGVKVRLMDLGLGQVESAMTPDSPGGRGAGTRGYRSPEQAHAADTTSAASHLVDQRADIYSLGATILSLSTKLDRGQWTSAFALASSELSRDLRELSAAMLSLSPSDRPSTMLQVAEQLRKLQGNTPRADLSKLLASAQSQSENDLPENEYSWSVLTDRVIAQTETLPEHATKRPPVSRVSGWLAVIASLVAALVLGIVWKGVWNPASKATYVSHLSDRQQPEELQSGNSVAPQAVPIGSATAGQAMPISHRVAHEVIRLGGTWESTSESGQTVEHDSADSFPDFPAKIEWIVLAHCEADDATLKLISGLPHLKGIVLSYTNVTDDGVKMLAEIKSLSKVYLYATAVTDESVTALATLPELTTLVISVTEVTNRSMKTLAHNQSLTRLTIKDTNVDGDCLKSIGTLKNLEHLDLREIRLDGVDLSPLLNLKNLNELKLAQTGVGAEAMATLMTMPKLRKIGSDCRQITASEANALMNHHPNVVILRNPGE